MINKNKISQKDVVLKIDNVLKKNNFIDISNKYSAENNFLSYKKSFFPMGVGFYLKNKSTSFKGIFDMNTSSLHIIYHHQKESVRIIFLSQFSSGTAYAKIAYHYLNFVNERFEEDIFLIVWASNNEDFIKSIDWISNAYVEKKYFPKKFNKKMDVINYNQLDKWLKQFFK